jgi:hypothetical protein
VNDAPRNSIFDTESTAVSQVTVTFFDDFYARTKRQEVLAPFELAVRIQHSHATDKDYLPMLKLGGFGDQPSEAGCLRHDANLIRITGVEGDYDDEEISLDEAKQHAAKAELFVILYTSPSYTQECPRWRVLCPFSEDLPPDQRDRMMARLNGAFGGIFAPESWTLSQAYFYGRVNNPDHQCTVFEGLPIDLAEHLDVTAIGRPEEKARGEPPHPASKPQDITDARVNGLLRKLLDNVSAAPEKEKHFTLWRNGKALGGYLWLTGWPKQEAIEQLLAALPATVKDWKKARRTAAAAIKVGMQRPLDLEDRPNPRAKQQRHDAAADPGYAGSQDAEARERAQHTSTGQQRPKSKTDNDNFVLPVEFSENWLAYRFSDHHAGSLLYVHDTGRWLRYEQGLWREDHAVTVFDAARKICAEEGKVALAVLPNKAGPKVAAMINRASCVAAIERLARHHHRHARDGDEFNADPLLLNGPVTTGTLERKLKP